MIDWLTLRCPRSHIRPSAWAKLEARAGRIQAISAEGEIEWVIMQRESIRSDSHQITIRAFGDWLELGGSPARVMGFNNVFGSGSALACGMAMVSFVERVCDVILPGVLSQQYKDISLAVDDNGIMKMAWDVSQVHPYIKQFVTAPSWSCTRMDITHNYDLGSAPEVRQALSYLRHAEGGRYQVRTCSESVYWGQGSRLRRGKAYHKGQHLRDTMYKKGGAQFTEKELAAADRLLRLELTLGSTWWRRCGKRWQGMTERDIDGFHGEYFGQFVGKVEVVEMDNMLLAFEKVAATQGQALAAFRTWSLIKTIGKAEAQASMPRASWYRHKAIMEKAGLTWADLNLGNVVPLRRRCIVLEAPVRSWADIGMAA